MSKLVHWLEHLRASIFIKLLSGFILVSLFMVGLTLFSVLTLGKLGDNVNDVYVAQDKLNRATRLVDNVVSLQNTLIQLQTNLYSISQQNADAIARSQDSGSLARSSVNNYRGQRTLVDSLVNNLINVIDTVTLKEMTGMDMAGLDQLMKVQFLDLLKQLDLIVDDTANNRPIDAQTKWKTAENNLSYAMVQIDFFRKTQEQNLKRVSDNSVRVVQDALNFKNIAQWILIVAATLAFILAIVLGAVLTYVFTRPVQKLKDRLGKLAEGDLATTLNVENRDEFGDLGLTFNQSIARLGDLVEQVQNQSVRISSAAAEIAAASRTSANLSIDQAGAVAEATVTIEELSHTALQIAEAASLVAQAAEQALTSVNEGQETVKESITGINTLKIQVQDIAEKILALNERSQRVGHIIEQVAGIADQTHLLALNAAIESAAAGESGKRFAVVAAEVKKLAERSRNATKEVQAVLTEIQNATTASVMATEQGMKQAEQGVVLAHRSGDANESIMQMVERTVQLASAISLATQQQRSASEHVVVSMRQLATVIQDGASSAQQSSSLASSLDEVATELRIVTDQFKVTEEIVDTDNFGADGGPFELFDELVAAEFLGISLTDGGGDGGPPVLPTQPTSEGK